MILELVTLGLAVASMLLHFFAPRTKTTVDDKVLKVVDAAKDYMPKAAPLAPPAVPAPTPQTTEPEPPKMVSGFRVS